MTQALPTDHIRPIDPVYNLTTNGDRLIGLKLVFDLSQLIIGLRYLVGKALLILTHTASNALIAQCKYLCSQYRGIKTGIDANRSHRYSRRHLHNSKQGIHTLKCRFDGNTRSEERLRQHEVQGAISGSTEAPDT